MVPALGIFPAPNQDPLKWDEYDQDRVFWTTSIVPMAGHIVIERLQCNSNIKVRVVVKGRPQEVSGCTKSTSTDPRDYAVYSLDEFERVVRGRWGKGYCEICAPNQE